MKQLNKRNKMKQTTFPAMFFMLYLTCYYAGFAQFNPASPSNWLYPDGNSQATRYQARRSDVQKIDSLRVKWATSSISGDVQPLIGNVINNDKIFPDFRWAPNEIAAIMGGKLVVVDATGKTHKLTQSIPFIKSFSVMFDSTKSSLRDSITMPVVLGIETIEFENNRDSLGIAYIAGFDKDADTVRILRRLAIDLRPYAPNVFASIKPVFGRNSSGEMSIYATVNMSQPYAPDPSPATPPYFRGLTQFNSNTLIPSYPLPDIGDSYKGRMQLGPEVSFAQPSISNVSILGDRKDIIMMPFYSNPDMNVRINSENIFGAPSYGDEVYLLGFDISGKYPTTEIGLTRLIDPFIPSENTRPQVRPYYIKLTDARTGLEKDYILLAEEYRGVDGSHGKARLHLFDGLGAPLTYPDDPQMEPPYNGTNDHLWSVATGNIDGNASNQWLPYYPNNPGNEIVVTQSSREFAVPSNRLSILRYNTNLIEKPTPPGTHLSAFDTLATQRINGWVAAVNDIDRGADNKDEIFIVDGSKLRILRMRDYADLQFRDGRPFDTVYTIEFDKQTISNVAVADLEGDGLNDIIVTTYDSTYVIGSEITDIIVVTEPGNNDNVPPRDYCPGDEVVLKWRNILRGNHYVNIRFREVINGVESDSTILVEKDYDNWADSVEYIYTADSLLVGKQGYFIVESSGNPEDIHARSGLVNIHLPLFAADPPEKSEYHAGEDLHLTGNSLCVDTVMFDYSYGPDSLRSWVPLDMKELFGNGGFDINLTLPCVDFYNCMLPDADSIIYIRAISIKGGYKDTAALIPVKLRPAKFPLVYVHPESACPTRTFRWDPMDFDYDCETVSILIDNGSSTFSLIDEVPVNKGEFIWNVPVNVPDCVYLRFCCSNSCVRTDTLIDEFGKVRPKYINTVAPNPFTPPIQTAEIVYTVPTETNVTVRVFDQASRLVATLENSVSRQPGVAYCARWDGTRDDGSLADNGMYYVAIELSAGGKEIHPIFVKK